MAYHHGDLAQASAQAAYARCLEQPAEALSVREVAQALDVTPRAIYRHHTDRDGLLRAACARAFHALCDSLEASGSETLVDLLDGYVAFALEAPTRYRLMFGLGQGALRELPIWPAVRRLIKLAEAAHDRAAAEPVPNAARRDAIMRRWGLVHGLVDLTLSGSLRAKSPGAARRYIAQQLRALG